MLRRVVVLLAVVVSFLVGVAVGPRMQVMRHVATLEAIKQVRGTDYSASGNKPTLPKSQFLGTWVPVAKDRGGLSRIVIAQKGKLWTIRVWAYATFTETDWGTVRFYLLGPDVESKSFDYGLVVWPPDFSRCYQILHIENGQLIKEEYTIFIDGSGRSNYRDVECFKRSQKTSRL